MYFSQDDSVLYSNSSDSLEVEIDEERESTVLCASDFPSFPPGFDPKDYTTVLIRRPLTEVRGGFLERFKKIEGLDLAPSVTSIEVTPALRSLFRKNGTVVCGHFGSYAEEFASSLGLQFVHSDFELARHYDEPHQSTTIWSMRFDWDDGAPYLHFDEYWPGSSAGNYGGGELDKDLPKGFPRGFTIESFARMFSDWYRDQVLANETARNYIEYFNSRKK